MAKLKLSFAAAAFCGCLLIPAVSLDAQSHQSRVTNKSGQPANLETPEENKMMGWEIANFVIFILLLGYGVAKSAPKFFNARSADIQRAIQEATGLKLDADFRYSEADRKLAALAEEIKRIRAEAQVEFEREHEQVRADTREELERLSRNVEAEIEAFRAAGAARARKKTADAALALAEKQLRDRAPDRNEPFVNEFLHLVEGSAK